MVNVFKFVFLLLGIHYGFVCFGRIIRKQDVPAVSIALMSIGIAGFTMFQWVM